MAHEKEARELLAEFNRYFTSGNGVDVPERVSVSRDEWRRLFSALASPPVQAREQAKAVAEVVVEPDYWSRGHFHKGYKKTVRVIGYLTQLPTGTKLYAHEHQGCEHWRNGACGREPCDAECRASPPAEQAKPSENCCYGGYVEDCGVPCWQHKKTD